MAVSIDRGTTEEVRKLVKDYVKKRNLTFLNLLDPESEIAFQYGVPGVPINFFINTQGKVVAVAEEGRKVIEQLLSESN